MRKFLFLLPLLVAACTQTAADRERVAREADTTQAKLDRALAGYAPDQSGSSSCLHSSFYRGAQGTQAYGRTLLFRVNTNTIYRTDTAGGCERVGDDAYLVTTTPTGDLCRGDIARVVDRAIRQQVSSCSFGDFVAYRRK